MKLIFGLWVLIACVLFVLWLSGYEQRRRSRMTKKERDEEWRDGQW